MFHFQSSEWLLLITWVAVLVTAVYGIRSRILSKEINPKYQQIGLIFFLIGDILMIVCVTLMVWLNQNAGQATFFLEKIMDVIYLPIYGFFLLIALALGVSAIAVGVIYFLQGRKIVQGDGVNHN